MLYLAISHATFRVVITVNDETSGIPPILGSALSADIGSPSGLVGGAIAWIGS
jgi:hypothetical protein